MIKKVLILLTSVFTFSLTITSRAEQNVNYGKYVVVKREEVGGTMQTQESLSKIQYVAIHKDRFIDHERGYLAGVCDAQPSYVLGPPKHGPGTVGYYELGKAVAGLTVNCGKKFVAYFDVLSPSRLGCYLDGYYFFLERND